MRSPASNRWPSFFGSVHSFLTKRPEISRGVKIKARKPNLRFTAMDDQQEKNEEAERFFEETEMEISFCGCSFV
ncbi:hypothetical protein TIFTF001_008707 [Ficus carica]|uniref:Uncharacterized protein n=1 Tax=Ficus carica TaxID=3494 RepID=A0AA87ZNI1_FICCA|nr:hypothetical protein TIFTF001_008707 [Ficus carica]